MNQLLITPELPNFHAIRSTAKFVKTPSNLVSKKVKFNVDFESSGPFRKTSVRDEKLSLISFPDSSEIARMFFFFFLFFFVVRKLLST